jgi:hypothetical protein
MNSRTRIIAITLPLLAILLSGCVVYDRDYGGRPYYGWHHDHDWRGAEWREHHWR